MECCSITLFFQPLGDVLRNTIFFKTLIDFFLNEKQTLNDNWLSFRRSYGLGYQGISTTPTRTQGANYVQLLQYVQLLPCPWQVKYWHVLRIAKPHSSYMVSFFIHEKSITGCTFFRSAPMAANVSTRQTKISHTRVSNSSAIKLPSSERVLFIDIKITSFKSFLEESHAIALESCYIFTKKCWTWNWRC